MTIELGIRLGGNRYGVLIAWTAMILALSSTACAQTPADHAKHHPAPGGTTPAPTGGPAAPAGMPMPGGDSTPASAGPADPAAAPDATAANAPMAAGGGGMGAGMGEMMKQMGTPPRKELYPSLMALPNEVKPEQLHAIEQLAQERMKSGAARISSGLQKLTISASGDDFAEMQQASAQMREGLAEFESGIAARRVLSEGKEPHNVALDWFKREMNLATPVPSGEAGTIFGVTPFHLFTMALLVSFALAMLTMYFFKMRRAAALFGRIDPDAKPPLAGGAEPPPPVKPEGGSGAPASGDAPKSSEKPATPAGDSNAPKTPGEGDASKPPNKPSGAPGVINPPKPPEETQAGGLAPAAPPDGGDPTKSSDKPSAPPGTGQPSAPPPEPPPSDGVAPKPADVPTPPAPLTDSSLVAVSANWKGKLRVGSVKPETPGVKTFRLLAASNDSFFPFTFVPGQFLNLSFWIGGAKMNRSYSISSSPTHRDFVDLTVRREPRGAVSRHMDDLLKVGEQIDVGGPVGKFTFTGAEADSIVLLSAGVGITPMMSIARYLTEQSWPGDIFFVYTCHFLADFIFADELAALAKQNPKLHLLVTISKPEGSDWKGPRGRITKEWLAASIPDLAARRVHVCGPPSMMEATKAMLTELGVAPERLKTEVFGTVKPAPAAPGTTAAPSAPATGPLVTFSKNNKSAKIRLDLKSGDSPPKQTILELSEELGIGIEFSCRVGTCGVCKVKLTSGEVDMEVQDALDDTDKAGNIILACQAKPKAEVAVEA